MESLKDFGITGVVTWHQTDIREEMRPSAFLNIAQELANFHADKLGFGYDDLIKSEQVWVLSRIRVKFNRALRWRDKFYAATWHKGVQGLFGMRDFALFESDCKMEVNPQSIKEAAITGTSAWLIMNTRTRRIERRNPFVMNEHSLSMTNPMDAMEEGCDKLHIPHELYLKWSHQVRYTDMDFNMHANNAKYIEWVMDSVDIEQLKNYRITEFQINYIQEAHFGDKVDIYSSLPDNSNTNPQLEIFYVGKRGDSVIFECKLDIIRETGR